MQFLLLQTALSCVDGGLSAVCAACLGEDISHLPNYGVLGYERRKIRISARFYAVVPEGRVRPTRPLTHCPHRARAARKLAPGSSGWAGVMWVDGEWRHPNLRVSPHDSLRAASAERARAFSASLNASSTMLPPGVISTPPPLRLKTFIPYAFSTRCTCRLRPG